MSTIIMSKCWPLQGMSPAQKAVLISLADQANDDGVCWPSVKTIAERTCLSERAVQGAIKWLSDAGVLVATERTGRSTVYQITPAAFAPPQEMRPADAAPHPRSSCTPPPQEMRGTPADPAPRTVKNHQGTVKEPSKARAKIALPDWLPLESWNMWARYRRTAGKWNEDAKRLNLAKLKRLYAEGHDPTLVIEQSIERGWTGLFPLKSDTQQAGRKAPAPENFKEKAYVGTDEADIDWL